MSSKAVQSPPIPHVRVAIVTGTSSGFGMLTAVELARKQYHVIAGMRNPANATELLARAESAGVREWIEVCTLDVTDPEAIERVVSEVSGKYGTIDMLVNNAGLAVGGFIEDVPMGDWRRQMETNFFGMVAMTKSVLPTMRAQRNGLIVNISSVSGRVAFPGYGPYAASKFAVEGFSESLRHEMASLGIRVVLVEPGAYRTLIWDKGLADMIRPADSSYRDRLDAIVQYTRRAGETSPDPQQVADSIASLIDIRRPKLRYVLGRGSAAAILGKALLPWKWFERIIARATRKAT